MPLDDIDAELLQDNLWKAYPNEPLHSPLEHLILQIRC